MREPAGHAVRRLLALRREGELATGHVRSATGALGVRERERAVWRWLPAAEKDGAEAAAPGERVRCLRGVHPELLVWIPRALARGGNASLARSCEAAEARCVTALTSRTDLIVCEM